MKIFNSKYFKFLITAGVYAGSEVFARLLQMAVLFYLAKVLSKNDYGKIGLLISIQQLITLFALGGLIEAVTGIFSIYKNESKLPVLFYNIRIVFRYISISIIMIFIPVFLLLFCIDIDKVLLFSLIPIVFSGLFLAGFNVSTSLNQLQGFHHYAILLKSLPLISGYLFSLLPLIFNNFNIILFFTFFSTGLCIGFIIQKMTAENLKDQNNIKDEKLIQYLIKKSLPFLIAALLAWFSGYGNNIIIKNMFNNEAVAEFTMVCNFNFILFLIINSINQVWVPNFLLIANKKSAEVLNSLNSLVNTTQVILITIVAILILLWFPELLNFVGGNFVSYQNIHKYLCITFSSYVILNGYYKVSPYFLLYQKGDVFLRIVFFTSIIGIGIWILLMYLLETKGIYFGFLFFMILKSSFFYFYGKRIWHISIRIYDLIICLFIIIISYLISKNTDLLLIKLLYVLLVFIVLGLIFIVLINSKKKRKL